ncbi:MAG TPA: cell division protein FtsZ [Solirubrobacteraceae bacterium]|jgi:cell division protein FtsZ|nr:cell division protein FtsZ [Solirubrobacteraceae bacterium]
MSNPKRASMREGPLAALFRKTEGEEPSAADAGPDAGAPQSQTPAARDERGAPHPALSSSTSSEHAARESAGVPTPKDRLKQAFSSEIPASLMDREGARAPASAPARGAHPVMGEYERSNGPVGQPRIRVVGVGGAGVNAVNRMVEAEVEGVEFLAVNTDQQSLQQSTADITLHIGAEITRGLGSGSDAAVGRQAAMEDYDRVKALLKGSDMIFITAGAGGGTGTGAAPIVARIAREVGALTVAIVTKPFGFEGSRRSEQAEHGIAALAEEVDTLIVVPNNRLLTVLDKQTAMVEAFRVADDVLRQGVQGISDLVTLPGLINLDFADVRTIMSDAGNALLGIGMGVGGESRAVDAAMQAVASPLLETSMDGAHSILLSITGGRDLSLWEVNEAAKAVSEAAHPDANIIFGAMVDEKLDDQVWVTVVATGYGDARRQIARDIGGLREPAGEPRVRRTSSGPPRPAHAPRRATLAVDELEVPEFLPHG